MATEIAEKSRRAIVTGWTEGRKTPAPTVEWIPITPSIFATATVIIVKDSVGVISMATANMLPAADGTKLIPLRSHNEGN